MKIFDNLNLYQVFYEVASTQNISAAAKRLYISQPAVSKSIGKLEAALDTKLFYRNSRGVKLTTEGEILFAQVNEALRSLQHGEDLLSKRKEMGMGEITIGVSTTLCKFVLLPFVKEFIAQHPHIRISISCQSSFGTIEKLKSGAIDLGLIGDPGDNAGLYFTPLQEIHDTYVATPEYYQNLLKRSDEQNVDLEEQATFLLMDRRNMTRQYVQQYVENPWFHSENVIELSSMDLLIDFAKTGLGVACVIQEFVEKELNSGELTLFPIKTQIPPRKIGLATLQKENQNPAVIAFLKAMQG